MRKTISLRAGLTAVALFMGTAGLPALAQTSAEQRAIDAGFDPRLVEYRAQYDIDFAAYEAALAAEGETGAVAEADKVNQTYDAIAELCGISGYNNVDQCIAELDAVLAAPQPPADVPVVEEEVPLVEEELPVIEEELPVIEEELPVIEEEPVIEEPVMEEELPVVEEEPVVEEPVMEEELPVVEEEPVVEEPMMEEELPVVEEEPVVEEPVMEEEAPVVQEEPVVEASQEDVEAVEAPDTNEELFEQLSEEDKIELEAILQEAPKPEDLRSETGEEVPEEEVAPVLDSVKDVLVRPELIGRQRRGNQQQPPAEPAPETDEAAQEDAQPEVVESTTAEQGERIEGQRRPRRDAPEGGNILESLGGRIVIQFNNQIQIRGNDSDRYRGEDYLEPEYERLRNGRVRETITRRNGVKIVTIYNRNGDVLRRSRITPDGREYLMTYVPEDYEDDLANWRDPGDDLPPLQLNIPIGEYVFTLNVGDNEDELVDFLDEPPVERVRRLYSVDEVKRSARIRDMVRRVEIDTLTFDSGSASLSQSQIRQMATIANAMFELLERNPGETFLIEGHTDATGSDLFNLRLSDRRAETVAVILSEYFGIPPENLATQGYGERYLKVRTPFAERLNRRVVVRRITPLVAPVNYASN